MLLLLSNKLFNGKWWKKKSNLNNQPRSIISHVGKLTMKMHAGFSGNRAQRDNKSSTYPIKIACIYNNKKHILLYKYYYLGWIIINHHHYLILISSKHYRNQCGGASIKIWRPRLHQFLEKIMETSMLVC